MKLQSHRENPGVSGLRRRGAWGLGPGARGLGSRAWCDDPSRHFHHSRLLGQFPTAPVAPAAGGQPGARAAANWVRYVGAAKDCQYAKNANRGNPGAWSLGPGLPVAPAAGGQPGTRAAAAKTAKDCQYAKNAKAAKSRAKTIMV